MALRALHISAILGAFVIAAVLWSWGQPLVSASGSVRIFVPSIWSSENSQQLADWYTLSHIVHGMLIALAGRLLGGRVSYPLLLGAAIVTGVAWEIVEHTEWVLREFRATTLYQGYLGDSVLNAVADYLWMLGGFFLASAVSTGGIVALIVALEAGSALIARDSLALTTIQVLWPQESISAWQEEIHPGNAAGAASEVAGP
jgi:hypothetical protein